jgi:predicted nucleotidyltransferase
MNEELEKEILEAARVLISYGAQEVYLFGSLAKGVVTEGSDVDLAVKGLPDGVFFSAVAQASRILSVPLDVMTYDGNAALVKLLTMRGEMRRVA